MIDFRTIRYEDTHVVWVAGINRYLQLKEPAFMVFEKWATDQKKSSIAKIISELYSLPEDESKHFVEEITGQMQTLLDAPQQEYGIQDDGNEIVQDTDYLAEHQYRIGNQLFLFIYRNEYLKNLFHPLFRHHEIAFNTETSTRFEFYNTGDQDAFRVNDSTAQVFPVEKIDGFQGAVLMEILNVIHHKQTTDWMGVCHASAVTDGRNALIFTAPSGSGKSSIALLMMANGFSILSDDFVPVAMQEPEIYHLPASISVKKSAIPFLQEYLPQLNLTHHPESEPTEFFLPPVGEKEILPNVRAKAIVFIKYDTSIGYELKKESNLEMMNPLIKQSWIAGTAKAAEHFLTWYFNLEVYTLRYSDNKKAVEGVRGILVEGKV